MKTDQVHLLSNEDGILRLGIDNRIDTSNADQIEEDINEIIFANEFDQLVVDLSNLNYISSVGIRILMVLFKNYSGMKIENTTPEVYNILEMTGMATIMPISKKLREISIEGLEKIGSGYNGAVYRLDDETIIKVINEMSSFEDIQKERDMAQKAFLLGIPTAISFDVVKVGNLNGIVYELLNTESFQNRLLNNQDKIEELGKQFGELGASINKTIIEDEDIALVKDSILEQVDAIKDDLSVEDYKMLRHIFEVIPDTNNFVHGDFHPGNVLIENNEPLLIDLATAGKGHPIFDLISFTLPIIGELEGQPDDYISQYTGLTKLQNYELWDAYLKGYFGTEDEEVINKIKDELMLFIRARIVCRLFRHVNAMKKQKQVETGGDQSHKVRDLGMERLTGAINLTLEAIRNTVENRDEEFFFYE